MPHRVVPLWQQRLAAVVIGPPVVLWAFLGTLAVEVADAAGFAWLEARLCCRQVRKLWHGEYVEPAREE